MLKEKVLTASFKYLHVGVLTFCFLKRLLVEFEFSSDANHTVIHFVVD